MKRTGLLVLAITFFLAGSASFVLGSWYIERMRDDREGIAGRGGSSAERNATYLVVPADAKSDWMTDFTLTDQSQRTVKWSGLEGKVRITNFFFSSCPATCLQQNQKVGEILSSYKEKDVVALSITCDPDIDDPQRLREYAGQLKADHERWLFLTGDLTYIRRVAGEMFQQPLDKQTHAERLVVADKWGNVRGMFHWNKLDEVTQLKLLVNKLLVETEPPAEFQKKDAAEAVSPPEVAETGEDAVPAESATDDSAS
jgi:cytochrome oxidase Cu insertion factor (SCO1/SenC/PrrC family)